MLLFWTVVFMYYKTRENAHFLDHSMNVIQNPRKCSFLDPSIYEVTLYEIVQGGDFDKSRTMIFSFNAIVFDNKKHKEKYPKKFLNGTNGNWILNFSGNFRVHTIRRIISLRFENPFNYDINTISSHPLFTYSWLPNNRASTTLDSRRVFHVARSYSGPARDVARSAAAEIFFSIFPIFRDYENHTFCA